MHEHGPKIFADVPVKEKTREITVSDFALIDELSGLTQFIDNFCLQKNIPEASKERLRARVLRYNSPKPKEIALNELRMSIFGDKR